MKESISIQERCNFKTNRLEVKGYKTLEKKNKKVFITSVINILTPKVTKYLPDGWQQVKAQKDAIKWITERDNESHFLTVTLHETKEIVGFIFLYEIPNELSLYELRFGYLLSEKQWGKGTGTELLWGLINWCKEANDIKAISGGVENDNLASIRVLEKVGFSSSKEEHFKNIIFYEYRFK